MTTGAFMQRQRVWLLCCLVFISFRAMAGENDHVKAKDAAKLALLQEIRDRIIWYDQEKTNPLFIPEEVIGLVPYEELPIPENDREGIRLWISLKRDWRSPAGQPHPACTYPRRVAIRPVSPDKQITVEQAVAEGPVSILVSVDKTTRGHWPDEGIYQYNEVTLLEILVGATFPYQDPLSTRAFLSEGGEIVVEGTRLCTISPWHLVPPHKGDTYLLVGAPDDKNIFHANFYFRIEGGNVVSANYSSLRQPDGPLSLARILSEIRKVRE